MKELALADRLQAAKSLRAIVAQVESSDIDAEAGVPRLLIGAAFALEIEAASTRLDFPESEAQERP